MVRPISIALDEFDLKLLDELQEQGDFKNRSILVKKCIMMYALSELGDEKFTRLLKENVLGEE